MVPDVYNKSIGVRLAVRLTCNRSLPLSCVKGVEITIDGTQIASDDIVFILNGNPYPVPSLLDRPDVVWFVLDPAQIFVPLSAPLSPGTHDVAGALHFVSPGTHKRTVQVARDRAELLMDAVGKV